MKTNAEYQREHRVRAAQKLERASRMEQALRDVIELLGEKTGEVAVAIRAVCVKALG